MKDFNKIGEEVGALVTEKNAAYGDSFAKCGEFLRLLFPSGINIGQYEDALALVRIFDKQMRIATRKDAFGESPYRDIAGYGILGVAKDEATNPTSLPGSERYQEIHTPLSKETVERLNLCATCRRDSAPIVCCGEYPMTKDGGCEGYLKREVADEAE